MFDRVLKQLREKVRSRHYAITLHADEEMDDDAFTIFDVENAFLFLKRLNYLPGVTMARKAVGQCDDCGESGTKLRRVSRSYGVGSSLFVIENVPVVSCPHCGESYLMADTLHELDRLKARRRSLASKRSVPVLAYAS